MSDEEQKAEARNVGNRPPLPTDAVAGTTGHIDAHNRLIDAIEDLRTIQDGKAEIAHSHSIPNVTGLQAALDGKAPTAHTHAQYLESTEVVAGANVTVDRITLPGSVIINGQAGGMSQGEADARYLSPTEIVAGNNITVDRSTTPGSVIINGAAGGGGGGLDQTTADERYINVTGDSMTGPLQIDFGSDNSPSLTVRGKTHVLGYLGVGYDWDGVGTISLDDANGDLYISPGFGDTSYGAIKLDAGGDPALLTGLKNPVGASDAANKAYVDGAVADAVAGAIPSFDVPVFTVASAAATAAPTITSAGWHREKRIGAAEAVQSTPSSSASGDLDMTGSTYFRYIGTPSAYGTPANPGHYVSTPFLPGSSSTVQNQRWKFGVEFVTSSSVVQFRMRAPSASPNFGVVSVNGRLVQDAHFVATGIASGTGYIATMTFPDVRERTIRVSLMSGQEGSFGGVAVETGQTVRRPTSPVGLRVAFIGDSYTTATSGVSTSKVWVYQVARALRAEQVILAGIGGTGWTAETSLGVDSRFAGRYSLVAGFAPDIVVFCGGRNETAAGFQSLVDAGVKAFPNARVAVVSSCSNATQAAQIADIAAACATAGAIPVILQVDDYPKSDGIHLTEAGHAAFAKDVSLVLEKYSEPLGDAPAAGGGGGGITQAEADNRYLMLDGGIVEGDLTVMNELVVGTQLLASDVTVANSIEVPTPASGAEAANKTYVDARGYIIALTVGAALPGGLPNGTVVVRY